MKRPQTKFHVHTMRESQVIRSKKSQNLSLGENLSTFFAAQFFFLNIDILLKLQKQILICCCKFIYNSVIIVGLLRFSDIIMLFCPLLDDWILCRISMLGEKCGLTVLVFVNAQSIMPIVFQLYDVLGFDFTVVINILINTSSPKLNIQIFF